MKKLNAGFVMVFFGFLMMATSAQAMAVVTASSGLNLRTGPGLGYPVVRILPRGAGVTVTGSSGAWRHVKTGGTSGWVLGAYLGFPSRTACTSTAHIGDSLSAGTLSGLRSAYAARGVTNLILSAYGARSVFQKVPADPETGLAAATRIKASGFSGCWVIALGTNDTANVAAGAWYTRGAAIDRMMKAIDPYARARVMWVNTYTTWSTGYASNANMRLWNQALVAAKSRWPNLRVFDWAAVAATGAAPFADGIHHTGAGYVVRNGAIADALARFFPR